MKPTPLETAESQCQKISAIQKNGRFAAIRQVLADRQRLLREDEKAARHLKRKTLPTNP